jgi:hypothetical protein
MEACAFLAKAAPARRRSVGSGRPGPIQPPPMPEGMKTAMRLGLG